MLLRFSVSNFLSFNNQTEFNLFTGDYRRFDNHVFRFKNKVDVLKLSAIYGANASGKSNLIHAIDYLRDCFKKGEVIRFDDSQFKGNKGKSSTFEIEFITKNKAYIFGLEVLKGNLISEYLYVSGLGGKDKLIFERKVNKSGKSKIEIDKNLLKSNKSKILKEHYEEKIESKKLFIDQMEEINLDNLSKEAKNVVEYIWHIQIIFPDSRPKYLISELLNEPKFKEFTRDMLCTFDTGIKDLHIKSFDLEKYFGEDDKEFVDDVIERLDENEDSDLGLSMDSIATIEDDKYLLKRLYIEHVGFGPDELFTLNEESDGTIRLIEFMIMLYNLIVSDSQVNVFIIDEIGRSIHPSLLKEFLYKLSNQIEIKGQLIFTTHESNLLDLKMLRPDEIWFAEKNREHGNTEFRTLAEYKKIRNDLDIRKGYLNGRFGGIPILANFEDINWTEYASS
jgi:AAA15 family ATPase/GTPase